MSVVTSPKASYREDHVLNFIEDRLEDMTPSRRWRILLLDAYSAHLSERVRRCAWHKGYVVITHGGGASSVAQTNDTDLHAHVKRLYLELEMADAIEQMRLMPRGVPCPRRQDVIGWMACLWSSQALHLRSRGGFLKVGLSNALDGTQDAEICREAGRFWHQEGMRQRRTDVTHDVDVEVEAGRLRWCYADVYSVINPHPARGCRVDIEPVDKGSESDASEVLEDGSVTATESAGSLEEAASSCAEGTAEGTTSAPMELQAHSTAVAVQPCAESTAVAVKRSAEVTADGVAQATQATIQSMRVVLQQVQAIGDVSLEAQVHRAIAVQERKQRILAREHPEVTDTMMSELDAHRWRTRKDHLSIRKAFEQEKQRRVTIQ